MLTPVESQCTHARQTDSHDADHVEVASSLAAAAVDVTEGQQADTPRLLPASSAEVATAPPSETEPQADLGDHDHAPKSVHAQPALIVSTGCEDYSLVADAIKQHRVALSPSPPRSSRLPAAESSPTSAAVFTAKGSAYQHLPGPPHAPKAERRDSPKAQHRTDSFGDFRSQKRPGELVEAFNGRWKHDKFVALGVSPKPKHSNHGSDGTVTRLRLAKSPLVAPRTHGMALAVAAGEGKQGVVHVERQVLPSLLWSSNGAERTAARERVGQELCRQLASEGKQPGEGTWTEHGVRWIWTTRPEPAKERAIVPSVAAKQVGHTCPTDLPFDAFPFLVSYLLPEQWRDKSARGANSGRDFNSFYQDILLAAYHPDPRTGKRRNIVRMGKIELNLVIPVYMKPVSGAGSFVNPFPQFELLHRPRDGWKILDTPPVPSGPAQAPGRTVNPIVSQKRNAPASDDRQPSKKAKTTPPKARAPCSVKCASTASSSRSDLRARFTDKLEAIDRWTTISEEVPESRQRANRQIARIQEELFAIQAKMRGQE